MQSTMQQIHEGGLLPIAKEPEGRAKAVATFHDRDAGFMFAQRAIALMRQEAPSWTKLAHELFGLNHEAREAAITGIKNWRAATLKEASAAHEDKEQKRMKRILASATVRISQLSTIAKAFNAGMHYAELAEEWHVSIDEAQTQAIEILYDYAKTHYSKAKQGRTPDSFVTKLGKFLKYNEGRELDEQEEKLFSALVALYTEAA